jgi:hypothetical protein
MGGGRRAGGGGGGPSLMMRIPPRLTLSRAGDADPLRHLRPLQLLPGPAPARHRQQQELALPARAGGPGAGGRPWRTRIPRARGPIRAGERRASLATLRRRAPPRADSRAQRTRGRCDPESCGSFKFVRRNCITIRQKAHQPARAHPSPGQAVTAMVADPSRGLRSSRPAPIRVRAVTTKVTGRGPGYPRSSGTRAVLPGLPRPCPRLGPDSGGPGPGPPSARRPRVDPPGTSRDESVRT